MLLQDLELSAEGQGATVDGYPADHPYPSFFSHAFTPQHIDAMLLHHGVEPPRAPGAPFRLLDLGCGDGLGLLLMAAACPQAEFVGIDAMASHVEKGTALAAAAGLRNVTLRCATFDAMATMDAGAFDYVISQGVLSWVSPANQQHLCRLAEASLRPGGIACFGYNAMPGWTDSLAFQHLTNLVADTLPGDGARRFGAAFEQVRRVATAGAAGIPGECLEGLDRSLEKLPLAYFAHEYLNPHWRPLWSSEAIRLLDGHGLGFVGTSLAQRLRPDFHLKRAQRVLVEETSDPGVRETLADLFVTASFRVDLFAKSAAAAAADSVARRLRGWWALRVAPEAAVLETATAAGTLQFDNPAARSIIAALGEGPAPLERAWEHGFDGTAGDLLNALDALFASGQACPAEPPRVAPAAPALNQAIANSPAKATICALAGRNGVMPAPAVLVGSLASASSHQRAALQRLGVEPAAA